MTVLEQLVFDLDAAGGDISPPANAKPVLGRHVADGAARLLRKLVATGLDPQAIESAAALVIALDSEAVTA